MEALSLPDLARATVERLQTQTPTHSFTLDFPPALPLVRGDERRLRQVFENLLTNAMKYSPQGGDIRLGGWREDGQVIVYVADQGIGIPFEEQEAVFERFYRVDSESAPQHAGRGPGAFPGQGHCGSARRAGVGAQPDRSGLHLFPGPAADGSSVVGRRLYCVKRKA